MASEAISECLILKIFLKEHAPRPPSLFTLTRTQWPYQSKTVGAGPTVNSLHLHGYSFVVLAPRLIPVPPSCLTSLPLPSSLPLEVLSAFGLCGVPLSSYFTSAANRANIITSNGTRTSGNSISSIEFEFFANLSLHSDVLGTPLVVERLGTRVAKPMRVECTTAILLSYDSCSMLLVTGLFLDYPAI